MSRNKSHGLGYALIILPVVLVLGLAFLNNKDKNTSDGVNTSNGSFVANTNKQSYDSGEIVWLEVSPISASCDSSFEVRVNAPDNNEEAVFSTSEGSIQKIGSCESADLIYRVRFTPENSGEYKLVVKDLKGSGVIEKIIAVGEDQKYSIERSGAGWVSSSGSDRYHMILRVSAKDGFEGQIVDNVPEVFSVVWQGSAKIDENEISWDVDLNPGESKELVYEFEFKGSETGVFDFGKAFLSSNGRSVYEEGSTWQVVVE